jgi:hypothetical protein
MFSFQLAYDDKHFLTSYVHACCLHFLIMVVVYMFFFHLAYDGKHVCYNMVSLHRIDELQLVRDWKLVLMLQVPVQMIHPN